jgi:hypothetical protein
VISNIILFREKSKIKLNQFLALIAVEILFVTELAEVKDCNEKQD